MIDHVGFFKNGLAHGYGKRIMIHETEEGWFVDDKHQKYPGDITAYDPRTYPYAKKIDINKYM